MKCAVVSDKYQISRVKSRESMVARHRYHIGCRGRYTCAVQWVMHSFWVITYRIVSLFFPVLTKDDVDCRRHDVTSGDGAGSKTVQKPGYIASTSGRISARRGDGPSASLVSVGGVGGMRGIDECARWSLSVPAGQRIRLNLVRLLSRSTTRPGTQQQQQQHWYAVTNCIASHLYRRSIVQSLTRARRREVTNNQGVRGGKQ